MAGAPKLKRYGVARMVRDVLQVSGFLELETTGKIKRIVLNQAAALARHCAKSWQALLKPQHVRIILGETVRHEVAFTTVMLGRISMTSPDVLPSVSYRSVPHWQRWGAKPPEQCSLIPEG